MREVGDHLSKPRGGKKKRGGKKRSGSGEEGGLDPRSRLDVAYLSSAEVDG